MIAQQYQDYVADIQEMLDAEETPKIDKEPRFLKALEDDSDEPERDDDDWDTPQQEKSPPKDQDQKIEFLEATFGSPTKTTHIS